MAADKPAAPRELAPRGRKFWRLTVEVHELEPEELELLREACRTLDNLDALGRAIRVDGSMVKGSEGQSRIHPAFAEMRGAQVVLGRLLKQLAFPEPEAEQSEASKRAQKAAQERWRMEAERKVGRHA
ncbi:hypothetical protein [Arthrobacter sp. U41]|uniref:hypothetical protein n=1 Tax=Arthrobacter sp. U41 TaxID=1849032 RepID=UPI0008592801|nr:hypothetical protein [Arthrobacter sp. U41]AOT04942.1 hypothetical protein ASPU41_18090 [Arthrobacter sp. U41]